MRFFPSVAAAVAGLALLSGCTSDDPGKTRSTDDPPDAAADPTPDQTTPPPATGGAPSVTPSAGGAAAIADAAPDAPIDAALPEAAPPDAPLSPPDASPPAPDAPAPVSLICGDAVRGLDEECDDGNTVESDFCTMQCRSRDVLLVGPTEVPTVPMVARRSLVRGTRVAAAGPLAGAALFLDSPGGGAEPLHVGLVRPDGTQLGDGRGVHIDDQHRQGPYDACALLAIPGDRFVAVWSARQTGLEPGSDVAFRTIDAASGALGQTLIANQTTAGTQFVNDAVWTGSELVVAWTDTTAPFPASASYLRRFDQNLQPLAADERIAPAEARAYSPFLTPFDGGFAHGWLTLEANSNRTVWVRAGGREWTFGPYQNVPRVQLVAMGQRHLFLTFNEHFDTGVTSGRRIWAGVLDVQEPVPATVFPITPLLPPPAGFGELAENQISLEVAGDSVYLAWTLEQNSFSRGIVLKTIPFRAADGGVQIDLSLPEIPLPSSPERRPWPQERGALVYAPWGPTGALFAASQDMDRILSPDQRRPDVVVQALPLPIVRLPEVVSRDE